MGKERSKNKQHGLNACYSAILFVVFALVSTNGFAQYYPEPAPVSPALEHTLLNELKQSSSSSQKIKTLLDLGNLYYNKPIKKDNDLDVALNMATQARDISKTTHDLHNFNDAEYLIANVLMLKDDLAGAENILKDVNDTTRAKVALALVYRYLYRPTSTPAECVKGAKKNIAIANAIIAKNHDKRLEILSLTFQALIDSHDDIKKTENEMLEVVKQYRAIGYTQRLQYIYYWLSKIYAFKGDFDKALSYGFESLKAMNSTRDTLAGGDFYLNLAGIYRHLKMNDKVIEASKTAIHYFGGHIGEGTIFDGISALNRELIRENKSKEALAVLQGYFKKYKPVSYGDKRIVLKEYATCYLALKNYTEAEKYYLTVFNMDKDSKSLDIPAYENMGFFYIETKNYAKAKPYLDKALEQLTFTNISIKDQIHLRFMAFLADSASGDYLSAIRHLRANSNLDHTVYDQAKTSAAEEMQTKYDTRRKTDSIAMLTQKELVQQANLKRADLIRNITIAGILVMIMISFLLYRNYKQKQAANNLITQKNDQLEHLLTEKEWLLKEVHHRVKNNLHSVISLLEAQAAYLENDALQAIEKSQHRIYAMSLIHQKLYQSDDIKTIDMTQYVPELVQYLRDSFDINSIHFNLTVDPIQLNASQAIPLGLIINEALTNSLKYAFPDGQGGEITISLKEVDGKYKLKITDNGIGIKEKAFLTTKNSLGLELIKGLAKEINGDITFDTINGVKIVIAFERDLLHNMDRLRDDYLESA